jgi:hypothetical protein
MPTVSVDGIIRSRKKASEMMAPITKLKKKLTN